MTKLVLLHYTTGFVVVAMVNTFVLVNYLAHFFLAFPDRDLMFGNFIGDAIKGSNLEGLSIPVQRGVRFHRFIDSYTDSNNDVIKAKQLFYASQHKYSGVVVDVLFDHLLAQDWERYQRLSLPKFVRKCYLAIEARLEEAPEHSRRFYKYMVTENILEEYKSAQGAEKVLRGMDTRTKFNSNMVAAVRQMHDVKDELAKHFEKFFPQLIDASHQWLEEN